MVSLKVNISETEENKVEVKLDYPKITKSVSSTEKIVLEEVSKLINETLKNLGK